MFKKFTNMKEEKKSFNKRNIDNIMSLEECDYTLKMDLKRAIEKPLKQYNKSEKILKKALALTIGIIILGFVFRVEIYNFITNIF